ncbi:hypothetical protein Bbelb_131190 [Branchiostoma belcheri]|nr:hypothetical protein Bbelb_131190 [Branchiostoma belcheri]
MGLQVLVADMADTVRLRHKKRVLDQESDRVYKQGQGVSLVFGRQTSEKANKREDRVLFHAVRGAGGMRRLLREATNSGQGGPQDAWAGGTAVWPAGLGLQLPAGVSSRTRVGRTTLPTPCHSQPPTCLPSEQMWADFPKTTLQRLTLTCSLLLIQLSRLLDPPEFPNYHPISHTDTPATVAMETVGKN